jgi:microcystin-dependent protein
LILAESGGAEEITLTVNQMPAHSHPQVASSAAGQQSSPVNLLPGAVTGTDIYSGDTPLANMAAQAISSIGGSQPHTNFQPYLCVNFIISLFGIFPSPS